MVQNDTRRRLEKILGKDRVKTAIKLAPYTTFKMGGPAEYYFEANTEYDLISAVKAADACDLSLTIIGGASNIIVSDKGIKGLVIRNLYSEKKIIKETAREVHLKVSSGYSITRLAKETAETGFSGLEYHCGLPGTVGGALYMNSKWTNPTSYVGDVLHEVLLIERDGREKIVKKDYFRFAYDSSIIQKTHEIVVWAVFKLKKDDPKILILRYKSVLEYRKKTQPHGVASSGCFFKNIDGQSAGELIDKLGLKGYSVGNLYISDKHANFVINKGGGKAADFFKLIKHIKDTAKDKMGVRLEEEVLFVK